MQQKVRKAGLATRMAGDIDLNLNQEKGTE